MIFSLVQYYNNRRQAIINIQGQPMKRVSQMHQISSIANYFIASIQRSNPIAYKLSKQGELEPIVSQTGSSLKQEPTCLTFKEELINSKEQQQPNSQRNMKESSEFKRQKKKYRSYTVEFKKKIIDEIRDELVASDHKNSVYSLIKAKSTQYGIHVKNIRRWYGLKEIREREGGRKPMMPQLEQKMMEFMATTKKCKRRDVVNFAKKYAAETKIPDIDNFSFSKGWYERFKVRHERMIMAMPNKLTILKQEPKQQQHQHKELQQDLVGESLSPTKAKSENIILVKMQQQEDDDDDNDDWKDGH